MQIGSQKYLLVSLQSVCVAASTVLLPQGHRFLFQGAFLVFITLPTTSKTAAPAQPGSLGALGSSQCALGELDTSPLSSHGDPGSLAFSVSQHLIFRIIHTKYSLLQQLVCWGECLENVGALEDNGVLMVKGVMHFLKMYLFYFVCLSILPVYIRCVHA